MVESTFYSLLAESTSHGCWLKALSTVLLVESTFYSLLAESASHGLLAEELRD
ncbi:MAG: hypothetical protein IJ467_02730 [Bacteroidaceae bacterium]|nr:hypothetical protein [Bacteroidaceae bacterium]